MCNWIGNRGESREPELNWRSCTCLYLETALSLRPLVQTDTRAILQGLAGDASQRNQRMNRTYTVHTVDGSILHRPELRLSIAEIFSPWRNVYLIRLLLIAEKSQG